MGIRLMKLATQTTRLCSSEAAFQLCSLQTKAAPGQNLCHCGTGSSCWVICTPPDVQPLQDSEGCCLSAAREHTPGGTDDHWDKPLRGDRI